MKTTQKLLLIGLLAVGSTIESAAQIYVTIRPSRPVYVRPAPPSPQHVWIEEDWYGAGDAYEWRGGYWAPPRPGYVYRPGYWRHTNRGYVWVGGRWSGRPQRNVYHRPPGHYEHGPGHGKGHGHGHGRGH